MAKPPSIGAIDKAALPGLPQADKLLEALNPFLGDVRGALSADLTVKENLAAEWKTLRVAAGASPGSFATALRRPVYAVLPARCTVKSGARPTAALGVDWEATTLDGRPGVKVHAVHGLAAGSVCEVLLLVLAE